MEVCPNSLRGSSMFYGLLRLLLLLVVLVLSLHIYIVGILGVMQIFLQTFCATNT